jgi:peroxiredoxin
MELMPAGAKAPAWTLRSLKGVTVSSSQLRGKIILLDFSFNECAACMLSIPVLNRLHDKYKGSNIEIATVNTSNTRESVARFVKKNNIYYPILLKGSKVSKDFQVSAYPTFIIIDPEGNIAASFEGFSSALESSLIAQIDKLK